MYRTAPGFLPALRPAARTYPASTVAMAASDSAAVTGERTLVDNSVDLFEEEGGCLVPCHAEKNLILR